MESRPTTYPPIGQRLTAEQIADKLQQLALRRVDLLDEQRATSAGDWRTRNRIKDDLRFNSLQIAAIKSARDRPQYPDENDFVAMAGGSR